MGQMLHIYGHLLLVIAKIFYVITVLVTMELLLHHLSEKTTFVREVLHHLLHHSIPGIHYGMVQCVRMVMVMTVALGSNIPISSNIQLPITLTFVFVISLQIQLYSS